MVARITSAQVSPERLDDFARWWQDTVGSAKGQIEGLQAAYLLADRQSGAVRGVGLWESQEALKAAEPAIQERLQQASQYFSAPPQFETLEIVGQV